MKDLLLFEWKKTTKSFYFKMMLILLILFVCFYYIFSYINTQRSDDLINSNEMIKANFQGSVDQLRATSGNNDAANEEIEFYMNEIEERDMLSEAVRNHDWATIISYELTITEDHVTSLPSQKEEQVYTWPTHFSQGVANEKLKWILEREIQPVFPIGLGTEVTAYDEMFETELDEKFANYFYNKKDSSSIYFLYLLLRWSLDIGGVIFFLFLFGNIFTKEGLNRNGSMNLLDTQPIKRSRIMLSKFITVMLLTFCIIAGVVLFEILLSTTFDRFGDWDYPVLIYEPDFSFQLMEMGDYILLTLLLFFVVLLFCYSLLFFYSVLIKQTFSAIVLTVLTLIVGITLSGSDVAMEWALAPYNPFNYFQINEIIIKETALTADNFNFTIMTGMISLIISSLLIFLLTYLIFRRRAV